MSLCSLAGLKILSFIPRRGKGHTEVLMSVEIAASREGLQPEDFIKYFVNYDKQTLTRETIFEVAETIKQELNLNSVTVTFSFDLLMSKLSPSFNNAVGFGIDCHYQVFLEGETRQFSMKVLCPVRVKRVSTLRGDLALGLVNPPPHVYFEDMLDIIQKHGEVVIYPPCSGEDVNLLSESMKCGKDIDHYIVNISDGCKKGSKFEKGFITLRVEDLYNMYTLTKTEEW